MVDILDLVFYKFGIKFIAKHNIFYKNKHQLERKMLKNISSKD
jgi:hypothetical protein